MKMQITENQDRDDGANDIAAEAARWHVATMSDEMDWETFTRWLDASPDHLARYREIATADARLIDKCDQVRQAVAAIESENAEKPSRKRLVWGAGAIAASLVAALTLPHWLREPETIYATSGQAQAIAFEDGSSSVLAPHSRLIVTGKAMRQMRLDGGAWFTIRHNETRSLTISAGPVEIRDIGTSFDVQTDGGVARVSVAEGQVAIASSALAKPISLRSGKILMYDAAAGTAETRDVDPESLGSWRNGQLRYRQTPLSLVAIDLARYSGLHLAVPAHLRNRQFTGILTVRDGEGAARNLALLSGLSLVHDAGGDRLSDSGQ